MRPTTLLQGVVLSALSITSSRVSAQVENARPLLAAQAIDGSIKCFVHSEGWASSNTGPCSDYVAPNRVAVGQTFHADGKDRTINVIAGIQATEDVHDYGLDLNKGEWMCTAGETEKDITTPDKPSLWLVISKCKPL